MVRVVLITLILLFTHALAYCQSVSVIHEYSDSKVAADMAISKEGNIFICGRYGGFAMLIKLDSNGNEQWINYYDEDYLFSKMLVDSNENIYLHMNASNQFNNNFLLKLDSTGNELWRSDSVIGIYTSGSIKDINLFPYQNRIYLTHNAREEQLDDDDLGISSFDIQTGELLSQTQIEQADNIYPYRMNEVPLKNGKWILTGYRGVLELEPNGNYNLIQMNDSIPGYLIGITTNGYNTYRTKVDWGNPIFPISYGSYLKYDSLWNLTSTIDLWPDSLYHFPDTLRQFINNIIPSEKKGLICSSTISQASNSRVDHISQLNPDDGSVVFDTSFINYQDISFIYEKNNLIIAIGQIGASSNLGIRILKIEFPDLEFNTKFYTSTNEIEKNKKSNTTIYPNPSNAQFTLQSDLEIETISIYSIDGKLVKMIDIHSTNYSIAVDEAGVYFVNITYSNEKQETQKIIKW